MTATFEGALCLHARISPGEMVRGHAQAAEAGEEPVEVSAADDTQLASRAAAGDYAAFEELVKRYRNEVHALAFYFVRNREDAWDISQEVFVKAHRGLKRFRGDASFKTWLMRITTNQCKDFFKKRRLRTVSLDGGEQTWEVPGTGANPERSARAQELGAAIDEALGQLSHKHRTALVLREFEGLSYEEMAEVMECSMGTVMSRLHHARKKMQRLLIEAGVVEDSAHA